MSLTIGVEIPVRTNFIRAKGETVIIRRDKPESKIGKMLIPGRWQQRTTRGKVISVGEKVYDLNIGDDVIYSEYADAPLGNGLVAVPASAVLGVVE